MTNPCSFTCCLKFVHFFLSVNTPEYHLVRLNDAIKMNPCLVYFSSMSNPFLITIFLLSPLFVFIPIIPICPYLSISVHIRPYSSTSVQFRILFYCCLLLLLLLSPLSLLPLCYSCVSFSKFIFLHLPPSSPCSSLRFILTESHATRRRWPNSYRRLQHSAHRVHEGLCKPIY